MNMNEFAKRRKCLMQEVGSKGVVILFAAEEKLRNGDCFYPFRQDSDFYYLTGFSEPEAVLVLAPQRKEGEYILFNRVRDRTREIWDGPRAGQEGARRDFGVDQAFPIAELSEKLPEILAGREVIHYPIGNDEHHDTFLLQTLNALRGKIRSGFQYPAIFKDLSPSLHEARLIKSPAEVAQIRQAVDITVEAHRHVMTVCKPEMYEYQLEAELLHIFRREGANGPSYSSIVGSGRNSCILHYINNECRIKSGDIILIDAGAEYQNYAADITRTFPANGRFSAEQRAIYEIVLAAQLAAIRTIKPGISWTIAQTVIVEVMTQGLLELGLLKGQLQELIEKEAYFPFYMHRSGHWLGLDVHDAGRYRVDGQWRSLKPGMVFTIEPGLYISSDLSHIDSRWHNIGVRIEDDILVTETGCEVLSNALPKTVPDIEAMMRG